MTTHLFSWNVNGIRASMDKGFRSFVESTAPDILCLQETKALPEQVDLTWLEGYHTFWNPAQKKGYSGVVILSKTEPLSVAEGIGIAEHDTEGRVLTAEFDDYFLINVYTPNAQRELARLPYRLEWDTAFRNYLTKLQKKKPVIFCGDLNVAHEEIDLKNPKSNRRNPGFSDEERESFTTLLDAGFIDSFRHLHPDEPDQYSWWSYRAGARARNVGWRIDYFGIDHALKEQIVSAAIHPEILGSDHCPVSVQLDI